MENSCFLKTEKSQLIPMERGGREEIDERGDERLCWMLQRKPKNDMKKGKSKRTKPLVVSRTKRARSQEHSSSRTHTISQPESIPFSTNGSISQPETQPKSIPFSTNGSISQPENVPSSTNRGSQSVSREGEYECPRWFRGDLLRKDWGELEEVQESYKGYTHYKKFKTDEERLTHVPIGVETDQWHKLVELCGTSDSQRVATQNTENRAHLSCYHRLGKRSYAEIKEEMKAKNLSTDNLSVYIYTRKMDEGASYNDGSAEKHTSLSSSQHNEEIAQVRQEAAEREIGHQKDLATMYTEMNEKLNKNTEFFINIMWGAVDWSEDKALKANQAMKRRAVTQPSSVEREEPDDSESRSKASELSTLCGAQVATMVFSLSRKVFSFGHPSVEAVIKQVPHPDPTTD
ncbi:hypothetical protein LguiB_010395 [Lonicera macranthoides]